MENEKNYKAESNPSSRMPWWVKSIFLMMLTVVVSYKILITPFNFSFDFPSFMSLLLALFSVGLAALFYFKATETSNSFYDNTYKFTREIAGLLVRIESGFGEKLKHLDETYKIMQEGFDKLPSRLNFKEAEKELKKEEMELQKIISEKDGMIQDLVNKSQLQEGEKIEFLNELQKKERSLIEARNEVNNLRRELKHQKILPANPFDNILTNKEVKELLLPIISVGMDPMMLISASDGGLRRGFQSIMGRLSNNFILWLKGRDLIDEDNSLTELGVAMLRKLGNAMSE